MKMKALLNRAALTVVALGATLMSQAQFGLIAPADNAALTAEGLGSTTVDITWESESTLMSPMYTWHIDVPTGDFSNPIVSVPSNNSGMDTVLTLDLNTINAVLAGAGLSQGQTAQLKWTVTATDGMSTLFSSDVFNISLTRGVTVTDFDLISPPDMFMATIEGMGTSTIDISWESAGEGATYGWLLDVSGGDFSNPVVGPVMSNNMGMDTVLTLDFATINAVLEGAGVALNQDVDLIWRVHAYAASDSLPSMSTNALNLTNGAVAEAFDLTFPNDGFAATIDNDASQSVTITWENSGEGVTYGWLLDLAGGDFSNPVVGPLASNNMGMDTALTLDFATIYSVLSGAGVPEGGTANLVWRVHAYAGADSLVSTSEFAIDLTRGISTSVEEANVAEMQVYPNPSSMGYVEVNGVTPGAQMILMNLSGQVAVQGRLEAANNRINTTDLAPGIYMLKVSAGEQVTTQRIVLQ